jgi:cytochrome c oxidase assembly protein subunit 15
VLPSVGPRPFLRVAQLALGLVVLNIVSGAAVRLSDSGLGCPDWPDCSLHHLTPPLSLHPAIEFSNRLVVVALCIVAAGVLLLALAQRPRRRDLSWLSAGLIAGILAEAVLGGVVVYSKLNPYVVMTHFMVGIALLTVAVVLALRAGRPAGGVGDGSARGGGGLGATVLMVSPGVRRLARAMIAVLLLAIAAGTATTGAGPHAGGKGAKRIPVPLTDLARTHAEIVIVLAVMTLALLYLLEHTSAPARVTERGRLLLVVMVAQGVIGYTQYFSHLPPLPVGIHVFGVTVLWAAMLWFYDGLFHHPAAAALGDGDSASTGDLTAPAVDPAHLAPSGLAPSGLAPSGAAQSGLAPSGASPWPESSR